MKRAEFDWKAVLVALHSADLSDALDERGFLKPDPDPAWPSEAFAARFYALRRRITAPPKKAGREFGTTIAELEEEIDGLFEALAQAEAPNEGFAQRWENAAAWLRESKRRARGTQAASGS